MAAETTLALALRHRVAGLGLSRAQLQRLDGRRLGQLRTQLEACALATECCFLLDPPLAVPQAQWRAGMAVLPAAARRARRLGFTRTLMTVLPFHDELPFTANFAQHVQRVRELAAELAAHGIGLGLEYLAPESRRRGHRYRFIHDLAGLRELCRAAARPNVGLVLDSFHWYCAAETTDDLRRLSPAEIVTVHLSDAVAGLGRERQQAFARELPGATDIIDNAAFVAALAAIGYRGPIGCEPMNRAFAALGPERAVAAASTALQRVAAAAGVSL
jgi:sugar phosphate isomerase/epimerase